MRFGSLLAVSVFAVVLLGSLFFHSGDAAHGATPCPFSSETEVICPMSALEHLSTWQGTFAALVPLCVLGLLSAAVVVGVRSSYPRARMRLRQVPPLTLALRPLSARQAHYPLRPYADLFARGILHPKLF